MCLFVCLHVCESVCLFVCLFVCASFCLIGVTACLLVCMCVCLFVCDSRSEYEAVATVAQDRVELMEDEMKMLGKKSDQMSTPSELPREIPSMSPPRYVVDDTIPF